MPCFWCNRQTRMTKEHVISVCNGGDDSGNNIVWACEPCNTERGELTKFWGQLHKLLDMTDDYFQQAAGISGLIKLIHKHPSIEALQKKWVRIETEMLGYSPSGELCLHVPELPLVLD